MTEATDVLLKLSLAYSTPAAVSTDPTSPDTITIKFDKLFTDPETDQEVNKGKALVI